MKMEAVREAGLGLLLLTYMVRARRTAVTVAASRALMCRAPEAAGPQEQRREKLAGPEARWVATVAPARPRLRMQLVRAAVVAVAARVRRPAARRARGQTGPATVPEVLVAVPRATAATAAPEGTVRRVS